MAAPGGQMPVGGAGAGAGAAAPAADPFPIPNDLTYADYFDFLIEDQIKHVHTYRPPMSDEFQATEDEGGDIIDVHTKYLKHFFENDPEGAQRALRQFIEDLARPNILRYYADEEPVEEFTYNIMSLINEYLKYGASLLPLSDLIASIQNDTQYGENYDPDEDYGRALRQKLQRRLKPLLKKLRRQGRNITAARTLASAGMPSNVISRIAGFLTGYKGNIGQQRAKLRQRIGLEPNAANIRTTAAPVAAALPPRLGGVGSPEGGGGGDGNQNGGRRTRRNRRNRSRRNKTRHHK